ncbi:MAG: peptide-methionine (R)-S-oxide reductase MsrB [Cyclobacteriaceae bacterium]|nr:peptide-methionine (R)-S-oxide reductase MsrB [Cyclobacteriaceae bacterium]
MKISHSILIIFALAMTCVSLSCAQNPKVKDTAEKYPVTKPEAEWKKQLTSQQFYVLRKKGTEQAFTGALWENHDKGIYYCAGCHQALFDSTTKFESGTGWPSFWQPIKPEAVALNSDDSYGMVRNEVVCSNCGGHLGHVFDDGPNPTGLRYCMNSVSMTFEKK